MRTVPLLLCFGTALSAQAQMVEGDVYDSVTHLPLAGVSVSSGNTNLTVARTDAGGHYRIQPQAESGYSLQIRLAGYLAAVRSINRPAQASAPLRIELVPQAVIIGKLEDEDGFPVERAQVQAIRYMTVNGQRKLQSSGWASSDDQGVYRLAYLPPGRYYVHVSAGDTANWDHRYVPQYLGGGLQPDEEHVVVVKAGEEHKGADFRLTKLEGVAVSGRVDGFRSQNGRPPSVVLEPSDTVGFMSFGGFSGSDGTFSFRHVPPGNYTLRYQSGNNPPKAGDMRAEQALSVGPHDLRDLVLSPHAVQPVDLEGQVVVDEGGTPGPWVIALRVSSGNSLTAHAAEDGAFVLKGLMPGHYGVQIYPDRNATNPMLHTLSAKLGDKEVLQAGLDIGDTAPGPLRITASAKVANISGVMVDPQGKPVPNVTLLFLSDQPGARGGAMTDDKGAFKTMLTAAGEYRVYLQTDQIGEDSLEAHQNDFPVVHAKLGENPPLTLVRK